MKTSCPRLFEVEALRDGRIAGAERARFMHHLQGCSVCGREAAALEGLAAALSSETEAQADALHVRRERTRLLAAFDRRLVPPARHRFAARGASVALGLTLALGVAALVLRPNFQHATAPASARAPSSTVMSQAVEVRALDGAEWLRAVENGREKISLLNGMLAIRVEHGTPARRLLVVLPDGELEDRGTTFTVSVEAGHTVRVTVQEGSVVLRLHGQPNIAVGAGETWSAAALAAPLPAPVARTASNAVSPARASKSEARVRATASASAHTAATGPSAPATGPSAPATGLSAPATGPKASAAGMSAAADPGAEFRAALSAFKAGDNAGAAEGFASFLSTHPADPRAEDAAYLRILALRRAGPASATERAAQDYLARYPHGFRRAEVEALTR